ncbi:unnamed protein product [Cuscuta epithymum]|uniref:Uncharacterized protein n=1 Tax=Cuscuta epithymum TaxID=186058 RepID=A0AAV0D7T2_9ASTE|nr:unnamed protein product [Cuscuta epithymum]
MHPAAEISIFISFILVCGGLGYSVFWLWRNKFLTFMIFMLGLFCTVWGITIVLDFIKVSRWVIYGSIWVHIGMNLIGVLYWICGGVCGEGLLFRQRICEIEFWIWVFMVVLSLLESIAYQAILPLDEKNPPQKKIELFTKVDKLYPFLVGLATVIETWVTRCSDIKFEKKKSVPVKSIESAFKTMIDGYIESGHMAREGDTGDLRLLSEAFDAFLNEVKNEVPRMEIHVV